MTGNRKNGQVLVVGAGVGGIRAALDLAEFGYGVTLIDKDPAVGGVLMQLDHQFPSNHCGICRMLPTMDCAAADQACIRRGLRHENITLCLNTTLADISGTAGQYDCRFRSAPVSVDPDRCNGCGVCAAACPVELPDLFNAGLTSRKAIYRPTPYTDPPVFVIDTEACTRCGACESVCPMEAIHLTPRDRKQFRILVVDDELIIRESLKEWLLDEGFSADTAASGEEALTRIAEQAYQLMLVDIKMPGMDGVTVLAEAKSLLPDMPVVMMTAYATVETAVGAMKTGAMDYLMKPFEPDVLMPKIVDLYEHLHAASADALTVQAIILAGGVGYYDPRSGKNPFGLGASPHIMTHLAFERLLSGTGPTGGRLVRPSDGKLVEKIAWVQCVGSRDVQSEGEFCSGICCMTAIKEALLAKAAAAGDLETTIFYMDMRTIGKSYQRYRDQAEQDSGVHMLRARVHSVVPDPSGMELRLRYTDQAGNSVLETADLVVLSVGQRPAADTQTLAEMAGLTLNPWGFPVTQPFSRTRTDVEGIFIAGSFGGLRDIHESVIQAGAAALNASRVLHQCGGDLRPVDSEMPLRRTYEDDVPRILVLVDASGILPDPGDREKIAQRLQKDPSVYAVVFPEPFKSLSDLAALLKAQTPEPVNRVVIGSTRALFTEPVMQDIARELGLDHHYVHAVHMAGAGAEEASDGGGDAAASNEGISANHLTATCLRSLQSGVVVLKHAEKSEVSPFRFQKRALVVGGGIAGLSAALGVADHGFEVDLIEQSDSFGGNLKWIDQTLTGDSVKNFLEDTLQKAEAHPQVHLYPGARISGVDGALGRFFAEFEDDGQAPPATEYGAVVLATGGEEAATTSYGFGKHPAIMTQKQFSEELQSGVPSLSSVVMIQCVDSREAPRNYCSRVCCRTSLRLALALKQNNPETDIFILYRDMMSPGFSEIFYTKAREAGVMFIQYTLDRKPEVLLPESEADTPAVRAYEPIVGRNIEIAADRVVLATGIIPHVPLELAGSLGVATDTDGFFQEAEYKWRPVNGLKEGVFGCGLTCSPCTIDAAMASAEAAAMGVLGIFNRNLAQNRGLTARVRNSLCSLCERCIAACPYEARTLDTDLEQIRIDPALCQGCGACAAVCPNDASVLDGYTPGMMLETIDAAFEELV